MTDDNGHVPDTLGPHGRALLAARSIRSIQEQQGQLSLARLINDHRIEDQAPGTDETYEERLARFEAAARRVAASVDRAELDAAASHLVREGAG